MLDGAWRQRAFIVFDDADLDKAAEGAMISKFRNNGQTCVCANRIYVQAGVYDAFAEKLAAAVNKLNVGDGLADGVTTGPLINEAAVAKVEEHIADALAGGGRVVTGGKRHALGGTFFEPTGDGHPPRHEGVDRRNLRALAPLFRFDTEEEVIRLANDTIFGLASYFFARDIGRITRVRGGAEYGMVGVKHRPDLDRGEPLWRRQAVGPLAAKGRTTGSRITSDEIHLSVGLTAKPGRTGAARPLLSVNDLMAKTAAVIR
ncbi:MAG: aldehyde dehydrogenase family protein [Paracoccaceae bacterium]